MEKGAVTWSRVAINSRRNWTRSDLALPRGIRASVRGNISIEEYNLAETSMLCGRLSQEPTKMSLVNFSRHYQRRSQWKAKEIRDLSIIRRSFCYRWYFGFENIFIDSLDNVCDLWKMNGALLVRIFLFWLLWVRLSEFLG